jgi:alkylation response protein AidB-like acyl-CoA dehydrogenase
MDFTESAEHHDLRKAVAAVTDQYGPDYFAERGVAGEPTTELWRDLGRHGFIGINFPEEYGGGGAGMVELAMVCEETAARGCPLLLLLVSSAISGELLARYGSAEQRREWLPRMATSEAKVVFAITEPDAGSNSHKISTSAVRDGDDYVLNGTKYYISGVDEAEALIVVTRTAPERCRCSWCPPTRPVWSSTHCRWASACPKSSSLCTSTTSSCPRPAWWGTEHEGFRQVFDGLNPERITGGAVCVGVGRHAVDKGADHARTRAVWGPPIRTYQAIAHPLAKAKINVDLAAMMTTRAAWLFDNGLPAGEASNVAKYAAAKAAVEAVDHVIQLHGGNGLSAEYGLLPQWGLARLLRIAPVSREMILNYVAQHSLSLPRSY